MGLFDFLKAKKTTAETAKNRLQIIIAQERSHRGGPDYCRCCSASCWK